MEVMKQKKKGVSLVIFVLAIVSILSLSCFIIDTAMVMSVRSELQKATDSSALLGASLLDPLYSGSFYINQNLAKSQAEVACNIMIASNNSLAGAACSASDVDMPTKQIQVTAVMDTPTYFAKILGISSIRINAVSTAQSEPFYMSKIFPRGIKDGSIIDSPNSVVSQTDTYINVPYGSSPNKYSDRDNLYGPPDRVPLSLGPGGFVTIKLPMPIVDKPGADLYIREMGNLEGYFVFAGVDNDPDSEYIDSTDASTRGNDIKWYNISCTGKPVGTSASETAFKDQNIGDEVKFYGSGMFDIGAECLDGSYNGDLRTVKYLKIFDDNQEDGFMAEYPRIPSVMLGEHSSISPGADIDSIAVLGHARLIPSSRFKLPRTDGLLDSILLDPSYMFQNNDNILKKI